MSKFIRAHRFNRGTEVWLNPAFISDFSFTNAGQAVELQMAHGGKFLIDNPFSGGGRNWEEAQNAFIAACSLNPSADGDSNG